MAFSLSGLCGVLSDFVICRDRPAAQYKGHRQPVRPAGEEQVKTRPTGDCALLEGNPEDVLKMHPVGKSMDYGKPKQGRLRQTDTQERNILSRSVATAHDVAPGRVAPCSTRELATGSRTSRYPQDLSTSSEATSDNASTDGMVVQRTVIPARA
jgi:hypothetical protein